jgi:hypothetical protein
MTKLTKPVPMKEVAIDLIVHPMRLIVFYASSDSITEFVQFGHVEAISEIPERYDLFVDARYDFNEVVDYIENYG